MDDVATTEQTDPPSPRSTTSPVQESPNINKIIESTEEIINCQAMKIFSLNQEVNKLKEDREKIKQKYQRILSQQFQDSDQHGEKEDEKVRRIDGLVQKILYLEGELAKSKMELAVSESQRLNQKFLQSKEQRKNKEKKEEQEQEVNKVFDLRIKNKNSQKQSMTLVSEFDRLFANGINDESWQPWKKAIDGFLLNDKIPNVEKFKEKTLELVKKDGIPQQLRGVLWSVTFQNYLGISNSLYIDFLQRRAKYGVGFDSVVSQIEKDISRSFYGKTQFESKVGLTEEVTQILEIFHMFRPDMSYVQGMTYPVIVLDLIVGKYKAFSIFCNLVIGNKFFQRLFLFDENYLSIYCRSFETLLKEMCPQVSQILSNFGIAGEVYLIEWFYTFFSRGLSYECTLKIWDRLGYEEELIFFKLALSIFECLEKKIISASYQETITIIRQFSSYLDEQMLLKTLNNHKLTKQKMHKYISKASIQLKN